MSSWPTVALSEVLTRSEETIEPVADTEYQEITVRLWGKGLSERGRTLGANLAGRRFVAHAGQFIVSRIDARNGAMGIVTKPLEGALVTNDFPLFDVNEKRLYLPFFEWLSKTRSFVELCIRASEGTTNRVRLKENRFFQLEIPLPPLEEQRRIVIRIEELAAKIAEAQQLRREASAEAEAIVSSEMNALFGGDAIHRWPMVPLEDIADIQSGVTLGRILVGKTIRLPYLRVANVQDGHLDLKVIKEVEILKSEEQKWQLRSGDILLTEGGDWDKLGRGTIWHGEISNCIHQNHIFRARLKRNEFLPEFVVKFIGSPVGKAYFQAASKKTTNLASINQRQLKAFKVSLPSIAEQRQIVTALEALQSDVGGLKDLQSQSAAELDALLPSILDRAFRGEL